jgi:hypothetical protein
MIELNFLFSSVTFLQLYIPLVIRAISRKIPVRFFIRSNHKKYADPLSHTKQYQKLIDTYNIPVLPMKDLVKYSGVIICVDGDIYGPAYKLAKTSAIYNIDRSKYLIISLLENCNFFEAYSTYINWIDYLIVQNPEHIKTYKYDPVKSLPLGIPKYDIQLDSRLVHKKYKLSTNEKYVVIFYPRFERGQKRYGNNFDQFYAILYAWLHNLGFKILVKNREKLGLKDSQYHGDHYYQDSSFYPNISMELLSISRLAIFFGSAVIEEVVMSHVPFIEFLFDDINRFSFLQHPKYNVTYSKTLPSEQQFKTDVELITNPDIDRKPYFDETIQKYLFKGDGCADRIIDKILELTHQT